MFTASDSNDQTLGTHLTCRHLAVGRNHSELGGFYGRCSIGTRTDRLRWVEQLKP